MGNQSKRRHKSKQSGGTPSDQNQQNGTSSLEYEDSHLSYDNTDEEDTTPFEPQQELESEDYEGYDESYDESYDETYQEENYEAYQEESSDAQAYQEEGSTEETVDGSWENWEDLDQEDEEHLGSTRNKTITCEFCKEDYSITYKRCPFCDERHTGGSGGEGGYGMDPRHIVGFSISMVLIFTAGFIVVKQVLPLLGPQSSSSSTDGTTSLTTPTDKEEYDPTQPPVNQGEDGTDYLVDEDGNVYEVPTQPDPALDLEEEDTNASDSSTSSDSSSSSSGTVTLSSTDVSLKGDESFTLRVTSGGTVTWTSSHPDIATVSSSGVVTNLNSSGSTKVVEITATVDGAKSSCIVRCASGTGSFASSSNASNSSSSSGTASTNIGTGKASITNAEGGLRVRSGPSTNHSVIATVMNGGDITVVNASTDGWYEISFIGGSGGKETGYIMGDYIKMG